MLHELARVLRPGGRAVIVDTDWDSIVWHSSDPARMQRMLGTWTQRYVNARVARLFPGSLRGADAWFSHAERNDDMMRMALAQHDFPVGDFAGNLGKAERLSAEARKAGADLIVFPELAVAGYPPEDLLLRPGFQQAAR